MAEAGARSVATRLDVDEFAMDHFPVNGHWFEVAQLVAEELAVLTATTEEVNTLLHHVGLADGFLLRCSLTRRNDRADTSLYEGRHDVVLFQLDFHPLESVEMEHQHIS